MNIGIVVAMDKELQLLLLELFKYSTIKEGIYTFYTGTLGTHEVVILKTGIGKVNSALGVNKLIEKFNPELIINTGVAGGCNNAYTGDIILASKIAYHDVWCGSDNPWGQADGCPKYFITSEKTTGLACVSDDSVKSGLVCSGDAFVTISSAIIQFFPEVLAVDMESASIAHVCYLHGIDLICLKIISDNPSADCKCINKNEIQYEKFWENAPKRMFEMVTRILKEL